MEIGTRTDLRATDDGSDWLEAADLCRRVARGMGTPQLTAKLLAIAEKFEVEAQLRFGSNSEVERAAVAS